MAFVSGNIWSLRYDGTNASGFIRIADDPGVAAFGVDPSNGDVLTADQNNDTIKRLIATPAATNALPATLAEAGVFTNLMTLTPHAGFVPYDVNLPFWSDQFDQISLVPCADESHDRLGATGTLAVPDWHGVGKALWLEMTNGSPDSRRRLETRLLVRHSGTDGSDVYRRDLSMEWSLTNATLMPEGGADEAFVIHDGGTTRTQVWRYPGRSECLLCHTRASQGGLALSFHTPQLNRDFNYGGVTDNQLRAMSHAGYFYRADHESVFAARPRQARRRIDERRATRALLPRGELRAMSSARRERVGPVRCTPIHATFRVKADSWTFKQLVG